MELTVDSMMVSDVITIPPDLPVENARFTMRNRDISALPVVDESGEPIGIISAEDLLQDIPHGTHVSRIMTRNVITIPRYAGLHEAARLMREKHIHHLVVTNENRVSGILTSFDLLKFVEEHRC